MRNFFFQLVFGGLGLVLSGCGATGTAAAPSETPRSTASEPAAPGQAQLTWYLSAVAGKEAIDDAALQQHFAPAFLTQIPPVKLRAFTESMRSGVQRLEVLRLEPTNESARVHALTRAATGGLFHVLLAVEPAPPHRITMLLIKPDDSAPSAS